MVSMRAAGKMEAAAAAAAHNFDEVVPNLNLIPGTTQDMKWNLGHDGSFLTFF